MVLHVFDENFDYKGRVENFISLTWDEEYQGEGKFTLVTFDTDKYAGLMKKNWYFYRADRPVAMMAVKVERDTTSNTLSVYGYTALHLLSRRIIDLEKSYTNVEEGVYDLINQDLRGLNIIQTSTAVGYEDEYECKFEGTGMLDAVLEMIEASELGIRARFDRNQKLHVIEVYKGEDKSYVEGAGGTVFSQEFGNLKELKVIEDDDLFKNVAYVTGADKSSPETIYYQYVAPYAGEQPNWREIIVEGEDQKDDESTAEWQARQKQIAQKALNEHRSAMNFEVEIDNSMFGKKYELGDLVTCKTKRYGLQFDTRITEYHYAYRNGTETVKLTIGKKPIGYVRGEIIKYG